MKISKTKYWNLISIMLIFCVALSCDNATNTKSKQNELNSTSKELLVEESNKPINDSIPKIITFTDSVRAINNHKNKVINKKLDSFSLDSQNEKYDSIVILEQELIHLLKTIKTFQFKLNAGHSSKTMSDSIEQLRSTYYEKKHKLISHRQSWGYSFKKLQNETGIKICKSNDGKIRSISWLAVVDYHDYYYSSLIQFLNKNNEIKSQEIETKDYKSDTLHLFDFEFLSTGIYKLYEIDEDSCHLYLVLSEGQTSESKYVSAQVFKLINDSLVQQSCFYGYPDVLIIHSMRLITIDLKYDEKNKILQHNKYLWPEYDPDEVITGDGIVRYKFKNGKFKKLKDE
ncbi:MAG: hypothetical protein K9J13_02275 [Saprospiraceae bacterium]|nr:hypothetical protein [Saprospiraceae bacterium]